VLADICAKLGRRDEAFGYLQTDFERHDPAILGLVTDPFFAQLHSDSPYQKLAAQVGFPPA
jgi:hypothetical protein